MLVILFYVFYYNHKNDQTVEWTIVWFMFLFACLTVFASTFLVLIELFSLILCFVRCN